MFPAPPTFEDLNVWAALPVIILSLWASVLLVADRFINNKFYVAAYSLLGVGISLVIALFQAGDLFDIGESGTAFEGMFMADQFTYVVNIVALISAAIGILISYEYLERTKLDRGEYYILLMFSAAGAMLMGSSNNLSMIFISLELLSIPLYILSGIRRPQEESEESAMKYFLLGAFSSSFLVYGIALVFGAAGSLDLGEIVVVAQTISEQEATQRYLLLIGAGLITVGLGFKVAAVPFHMWTPDVYQGAPTPVTAYMSSVAKVGGFAAFLRVLVTGLPIIAEGGDAAVWVDTLQILAALTLLLGNLVAIMQYDLKRLLAYSSIAHAGYILIALAAGGVPGVGDSAAQAALVYLAAYAFTNIGAFAVVAAIEKDDSTGTTMDDIKGLAVKRPWLAGAMSVFMFSLTGIPLTAGFIGKFWVFRAAMDAGLEPLAVLGVLTSAISAFYYVRVVWNMYFETGDAVVPERQQYLTSGLVITAAGTLILGLLPFILENLVRDASLAILR
ncbi:MAG: NADH-quinone oxidoreductase subunit N [Anaerolineae bacterium]|nr:MAG: NADH-quinone oxidoreductase subunit N [Anaerolineae bacterium]